jgi:diacylglycerol kinase (ATP)
MKNAFIIMNPAAGRGQARTLIASVQKAFALVGANDIRETRKPGDEEFIAADAVADGVRTIIAVGGDGTCSRIANAILRSGVHCSLGVVPCGSGNDFAKTLGVAGRTPAQIADLLVRGKATSIDVGVCDGHYFLNSGGFGFDSSVLEATKRVRFLKGDAVYIYSALRQLFTYRGVSVSLDSSAEERPTRMLMLTVSNGQFLGGAFRIAPHASAVDGMLDVGLFKDAGLAGRMRIFAGAFRGTHVRLSSVETKRVSAITLGFLSPPMMEVDGELRRALSSTVKIECVPRGLNVIAAPGYPR